jgi:hypothetical protein
MAISKQQISTVLCAVAILEGWDAAHPSVTQDSEGGWEFMRDTGISTPKPTRELIDLVSGLVSEQKMIKEHRRTLAPKNGSGRARMGAGNGKA